jgi:HAMP domain-containing protein
MLARLSIPVRLLLLLTVPLAALMIVALAGLATINATNATTQELQARLLQQARLEAMREALRDGALATANASAMASIGSDEAMEQLKLARNDFDTAGVAFVTSAPERRRARAEAAIQPILQEYSRALSELENLVLDGDPAAVRGAMSGEWGVHLHGILTRLGKMLIDERAASDRLIMASSERGNEFFSLNATLGFAGLGLALLFGYYISRSITSPVRTLTATVHAVAAGNIEVRTNLAGQDEIAVLSVRTRSSTTR